MNATEQAIYNTAMADIRAIHSIAGDIISMEHHGKSLPSAATVNHKLQAGRYELERIYLEMFHTEAA